MKWLLKIYQEHTHTHTQFKRATMLLDKASIQGRKGYYEMIKGVIYKDITYFVSSNISSKETELKIRINLES